MLTWVRLERSLDELHEAGMLERRGPQPRLSVPGGQVVMELLRAEREGVA